MGLSLACVYAEYPADPYRGRQTYPPSPLLEHQPPTVGSIDIPLRQHRPKFDAGIVVQAKVISTTTTIGLVSALTYRRLPTGTRVTGAS